MANQNNTYQVCGMLNRVFAAYFMNVCSTNEGINFEDSKPTMSNIACHNEQTIYFTEKDSPHGLKHFFHGRMVIEDFDLDKFMSMKVYEYIDNNGIREKLADVARYFANAVNSHKYCDFVFSSLPDAAPHIYDCLLDPDTNFRSRLIIGRDLVTNNFGAIWEFYCLLMTKFREVDKHEIYEASYKAVDYMTDEEKEKFNKKIEVE